MRMSHRIIHQYQGGKRLGCHYNGILLFLASQLVSKSSSAVWYFGHTLLMFLPRHCHCHWGAQALNNKMISFHSNQAALPTLVHLFKTLRISGSMMSSGGNGCKWCDNVVSWRKETYASVGSRAMIPVSCPCTHPWNVFSQMKGSFWSLAWEVERVGGDILTVDFGGRHWRIWA